MREAHQIVETEGAAAALNRMDGAEDRVQGLRVNAALVHLDKAGFQFGELLLAFLEERLPYGRHRIQALGSPWDKSGRDAANGFDEFSRIERLDDPTRGAGLASTVFLFDIAFRRSEE